MRHFFFLFLAVIPMMGFAQVRQKINIVTHNRVTVVTNPKTGENGYMRWGVFPSPDAAVRKIVLHLTLGTPDAMKTAHWDYCDNIYIRRQGGVNGQSLNYEIARMLTPYGSIFDKGWQFEWTVDVTDFSKALRDSVEIEYRHSGYEPDTVGWALTLDFEILRGPEVVHIQNIYPLWNGHFKYGDPTDPIEKKLYPGAFKNPPECGISRVRILHTGHGMDEPRGCSEFCSRWRDLYCDEKLVQHRVLWKDCGNNPLYPQGGTWIYDRANWCPGDLLQPDIIDIPSTPEMHILSMKMEPYLATKNIQAVENICTYFFQLSKPLHKVDAAIEQIAVPNNHAFFNRSNPACFDPRILVRNLGSDHLRSLTINYGTSPGKKMAFRWSGNLAFNESCEINLPGLITCNPDKNTFEVVLTRPNGKRDAWEGDNSLTSNFDAPKILPTGIIVRFKTNHHPHDNTLLLINSSHDTIYQKLPQDLKADTVYTDTLHLEEGPCQFILSDTTGDGLEFWAEPGQGYGYLRFCDLQGRLVHVVRSDCGNGEQLSFQASRSFVKDTTVLLSAFSLYPRNLKDKTELDMISDRPAKMTVIITIDGQVIERHEYENISSGTFPYYLGYLPKGRIVLEALLNGKNCFKGRIFRDF